MKTKILALMLAGFASTTVLAAGPATHSKKADFRAKEDALAPEISLVDLKSLIEVKDKKAMVIIDANGEKSYKEGHVPGAIHFAKVESNFAASLPADKSTMIVAYCGSPMCTAWEEPATKAKELGYTNIRHLRAGIKGWRDAKYPTQN